MTISDFFDIRVIDKPIEVAAYGILHRRGWCLSITTLFFIKTDIDQHYVTHLGHLILMLYIKSFYHPSSNRSLLDPSAADTAP